jgi:predicted nucleic acid-binding protein
VIYLDSSAVVKLARRESETDALKAWLAGNPRPLITSALARTESTRALRRSEPAALLTLGFVLATIHQVAITDDILDAAAAFPGPSLRSLDAIHLATAELLSPHVAWFIAYDKRLEAAATTQGLTTIAPR